MNGWHEAAKPDTGKGFQPRASLVKAVLLNSAETLLGIQDDQTQQVTDSFEYDMNQGYGRINLLRSLPVQGQNSLNGIFINTKRISTGQEHVYDVIIAVDNRCDEPLSATLTWTDPPVGPMCNDCKYYCIHWTNLYCTWIPIFNIFSSCHFFCRRLE
jgi:hypothetical protein